MRWIENWYSSFLMVSTSSITTQSLGKIVLRAPAVGGKIRYLYVFYSARRIRKRDLCYGNVAGWVPGWLAGCHTLVLYQYG